MTTVAPFDVTDPAPKRRGRNQHTAGWKPERVEELRRRWAVGESFGVISAAMKLSRNQARKRASVSVRGRPR
jgi:hypothetical protein